MSRDGKAALARAAMQAVEPLVELLLELGITSPEAESLLRSLFVHKAREWLSGRDGEQEPSDVRIALVTGVHRNFVRSILDEPPRIAPAREQKGHRATRLLEGWHSDPKFLDSNGKPRDLSEREQEPSFHALSLKYLPGASPNVVLEELRRAGLIQMLAERRVRVLGRSFRSPGLNARNINDLGHRAQALLETLIHNVRMPAQQRFCQTMPPVEVDESRAAFVRDLIARRTGNFLAAMEQELATESVKPRRSRAVTRTRIGLTALVTER